MYNVHVLVCFLSLCFVLCFQKFREAYRETENTNALESKHSLVGFPFPSQPLMLKSPPKSDQTRDKVTTQPAPPTGLLSVNPVRIHTYYMGGTPQQVPAGTPTKTAAKDMHVLPGAPSQRDLYGVATPTAVNTNHLLDTSRASSPVVDVPLRLEANCGAQKASESRHEIVESNDVHPTDAVKGGSADSMGGNEMSVKGEAKSQSSHSNHATPPSTLHLPPSNRAQLTNGLDLPHVKTSIDGTSMVPGVKSLKIPSAFTCITFNNVALNPVKANIVAEHSTRVNSAPQLDVTCSSMQDGAQLRHGTSCDMLRLKHLPPTDNPDEVVTKSLNTVKDGKLRRVGKGQGDGEGVKEGDGDREGQGEGVGEGDGDCDGVGKGEGEGEGVGEGEGDRDEVGKGEEEGKGEGKGDREGVEGRNDIAMMGIRNMLAVPQSSARVRRQQGYSRKSKKPMIEVKSTTRVQCTCTCVYACHICDNEMVRKTTQHNRNSGRAIKHGTTSPLGGTRTHDLL